MKKKITHSLLLMLMAMVAPWLTACSDVIYDEEGDCEVTYQLQFIYDKNMKWADAFSNEVKSVRVYVFDENDNLVWTTTESGPQLASGNYRLKMPLKPGKYHILAWCGADNNTDNEHFNIPQNPTTAVNSFSEATCYLMRNYANGETPQYLPNGAAYSNKQLHPLFHGETELELPDYSEIGGTYTYPVHLTKDTNTIRIVLQQLNGKNLNADDFIFTITDNNGYMAADNSLINDEKINYRPWATYSGTAGTEERDPKRPAQTRVVTNVNVAQAELTTARLMADRRQDMQLTITRKSDGVTIVRIPVIDYCLLVKGLEHSGITDQDYLDRQDEYSMVFFLDEDHFWISSVILINSWRIVFQNQDLN